MAPRRMLQHLLGHLRGTTDTQLFEDMLAVLCHTVFRPFNPVQWLRMCSGAKFLFEALGM